MRRRGFTLTEVLVAAGLLLMLIVFGLEPLLRAQSASRQTDLRLRALRLGQHLVEEVRATPYQQIRSAQGRRDEFSYVLRVAEQESIKTVFVEVQWNDRQALRSLDLTTQIGEGW